MRLSGVNTDRWKIAVYALAGGICGVAGLLIASRLNSAQPALGQGYELDAIAAVVIGGTSLCGGRGTIIGTLIGALIISVLANGLRILSVAQEWQTVVTGLDHHSRRVHRHPAAAPAVILADFAQRKLRQDQTRGQQRPEEDQNRTTTEHASRRNYVYPSHGSRRARRRHAAWLGRASRSPRTSPTSR